MGKRQRRRERERGDRKFPWESVAAFRNRVAHTKPNKKSTSKGATLNATV